MCILLLLYAVIINVEQQLGTQRYYVNASVKPNGQPESTEAKALQCVGKKDAIDFEIKFENMAGLQQVEREKMHVFSKWINCGVF